MLYQKIARVDPVSYRVGWGANRVEHRTGVRYKCVHFTNVNRSNLTSWDGGKSRKIYIRFSGPTARAAIDALQSHTIPRSKDNNNNNNKLPNEY